MNCGKNGRPYQYHELFMVYAMFYFRLPYRQMEGLLQSYHSICMAPDYTMVQKRVCTMAAGIRGRRRAGGIVLAIDSTGIKVTK